ncbi:hypothetical protein DYU05_20255 [Mucilaginibacter terrenus]|uniref:DUF4369 domain-containing protein n=1 Tax=Mucilaginibacter terrenus TaxID=2482727 RepID=A0A3E2NJD5_9SPHI|nr:hypothetical protein [Mucilaginibacter terrenus]RFZ81095.1 hypothetical protein DYU05_20255 [Mucilaginibacter terrenus]
MKTVVKNLKMIAVSMMLIAVAACKNGHTTTIVEHDDNHRQKIKYSGTIVFNPTNDGIEHISPGGYLEFEDDDRKFEAKQHTVGGIYYRFNGDSEINVLDADQKRLVAKAVKAIEKANRKH